MTRFSSPHAIIVYDNLEQDTYDISQRLKDFLRFKTHGQIDIKVFETKNISRCLAEISNLGYPWATVATPGNFLQSQELFIRSIEHAQAENSPLACHILDRGGYYHFHPQWFSIDLAVYQKIGFPKLEEFSGPMSIRTRRTERSCDNVHDNYTPWWVRPCSDEDITYVSDHGYFGINLVAELVRHGYTVTNIPQLIRNRKNFCYPGHNAPVIRRIMDGDPAPVQDEALRWFVKGINQLTSNLRTGYYVLNTEQLVSEDHILLQNKTFNNFMGVCGGLKPACVTGGDNWQPNSRVVLFDISPAAIEYQKFLLANWDGNLENFENVFRRFESSNPGWQALYFGDKSIAENIRWFLDSANLDEETFRRRWQKYLEHQHEFVELDLLQDNAILQIADLMRECSSPGYFWASNVFYMDYLMFYKGREWTDRITMEFIDNLKQVMGRSSLLELSNSLHALN